MTDDIIYDVDLAKDVKDFVSNNADVTYSNNNLKDAIFAAKPEDILRVGKLISSLKIVSVNIVDNSFLKKVL